MKGVMKEVAVEEPHRVEVRKVPVPELSGESEVLVQMKSASVYGSDHHIYHGPNPCPTYPCISGRENTGVVVEAGSAAVNIKMSDHVIVDLISTCGVRYQCRIGRKGACEHMRVRDSGADGGWREYFTVPVSGAYKVDDSMDWKDAALVEPYTIGAHCTDRARIVPEGVVFILGTGITGSIILQTCKAKGYQMVICCGTDDVSLQRAKEYGADYVIDSKMEDVVKRVTEITHNHDVTVTSDSACLPGSLTMCIQPGILCNTGRMVPLGFSAVKEEITQTMINQREPDVTGSRMLCSRFEPTIQRIGNGEFSTKGIATVFTPFSEIDKAFYYMDHPCTESKKTVTLSDWQRS